MKKTFFRKQFTAVVTDEDGRISFTGDIDGSSGAVGDKIVAIDPEFVPINRCHLCDSMTGFPMHCIENAVYHFEKKFFAFVESEEPQLNIYQLLAECLDPACDDFELIVDGDVRHALSKFMKDFNPKKLKDLKKALIDSDLLKEYFADRLQECYDAIDEIEERDSCSYTFNDEFDNEVNALAKFLDISPDDVDEQSENTYKAEGKYYIVADEDDADALARESIESYVTECVLSEIPEQYQRYFNTDEFVEDVLRYDGRANSLASHDGYENYEMINDTCYYIYRC